MTSYETLLWLHVSLAVLWAGGAIMLVILGARISPGDNEARAYFAAQLEWLGLRFFAPVSVLTLVFGVLLAVDGDWDFGSFWISASFLLFFASFLTGAAYLGPTSAKASRRISEHGVDDEEGQRLIGRMMLVGRIDTFVLLALIFLMTTKPGA